MLQPLLAVAALLATDGSVPEPITVRVLVINYDPAVPSQGGLPLHQVLGWQDPRELADQYEAEVEALRA